MSKGSSLLELLIVVVLTALVAVIATSLLFTTLGSSRKASGLVLVKQNGDQAIQLLERQIREAKSASCPNPYNVLTITDQNDDDIVITLSSDRVIQTPGGFLTGDQLEAPVFVCSVVIGGAGVPDFVEVSFTLTLAPGGRPAETVSEEFQTRVSLRTYE